MQPGETVIDLGSGAGFDCFLAAGQVGATGPRHRRVDMTHEMLTKARGNAASIRAGNGRISPRRNLNICRSPKTLATW